MNEPTKDEANIHERSKQSLRKSRRGSRGENQAGEPQPAHDHSWGQLVRGFMGNDKHIADALAKKARDGASLLGAGSLIGAGLSGFSTANDMINLAGEFVGKKKVSPPPPKGAGTKAAGEAAEEVVERTGARAANRTVVKAGQRVAGEVTEEVMQGVRGGRGASSMFRGLPKLTGAVRSVIPSLTEGGGLVIRGRTMLAGAGRITGGLALTTLAIDVGAKTIEARTSGEKNPYSDAVDNQVRNNPAMGLGDKVRLLAAKQLGTLIFAIDRGREAGVEVLRKDMADRSVEGSERKNLLGKLADGARDRFAEIRAGYESVTTTMGTLVSEQTKPSNWRLPANGILDRGTDRGAAPMPIPIKQIAV